MTVQQGAKLARRSLVLSMFGSAVLTACGGGGGGSSATAPAPAAPGPAPSASSGPVAVSTLSVLAGAIGGIGFADGQAAAARFDGVDIAYDAASNAYVLDFAGAIRRVAPSGEVTTIDGVVPQNPRCIARDSAGNIYIGADSRLYPFTPAGLPTVLAGSGTYGGADGTGAAASFGGANGLACDAAGVIFVADANGTVRRVTSAGEVSTLAGSVGNFDTVDGIGSAARFFRPSGIAVEGSTVVVADVNAVRKVAADGSVTTIAITPFGDVQSLVRVACDGNGVVYVGDESNHVIRRVSINGGSFDVFAGASGQAGETDGPRLNARLSSPRGLACRTNGLPGIMDGSTLRTIDASGNVATLAGVAEHRGCVDGSAATARFDRSMGVCSDSQGRLTITDFGSQTLRMVGLDGSVSTIAGLAYQAGMVDGSAAQSRLSSPTAVTRDGNGNVYFCSQFDHRIRRAAPDGSVSTFAGDAAPGAVDGTRLNARFNGPAGLAMDPLGNLYVADSGNFTIRRIAPDGIVTTVAGLPGSQGNTSGEGPQARFGFVTGVACDASGTVYATEAEGRIRRITPQGTVSQLLSDPDMQGMGPVACDTAGNIYFSNYPTAFSAPRIERLTPAGVRTLVAGRDRSRGVQTGTGTISLNYVQGMASRPDGSIAVLSENAVLLLTFS